MCNSTFLVLCIYFLLFFCFFSSSFSFKINFTGDKCFYLSNQYSKDQTKQVVSYQCCPKVPEKDKRVSLFQRDNFIDEGPCFQFPQVPKPKNQKLVTSKTFTKVTSGSRDSKPTTTSSKSTAKDAKQEKVVKKQKASSGNNDILDTNSFEKWITLIRCIFTDRD